MKEYHYTVVFEKDENGVWLAHVPALNNIATEGDTLEEAKRMAREAIEGYIECLVEDNLPIPVEQSEVQAVVEKIVVAA